MRPTKVIIHLSAIEHNFSLVKKLAPDSRIMAVVKADAYGHGIVKVAQHLAQADAFAVACIEEAIELRQGGIEQPIVLLEGFFEPNELALIDSFRLETVIHNEFQLQQLAEAQLKNPIPVWIKLDTEMNRLGFSIEEFESAFHRLQHISGIASIRLMTHFSCADDVYNPQTSFQLQQFKTLINGLPGERSAANSAAVIAWPETHFEWVRPGLLLYGCSPLTDKIGSDHQLKPAMSLESKIIALKSVKQGQAVGYGANWVATSNTEIAIVAIGYGDGYPRHALNGTPVWINDRLVPIAGRVSMDMIAVDLGQSANDNVGDRVVLWGPELPVETVASYSDTIPYTLLCGVTPRVKFEWRDQAL